MPCGAKAPLFCLNVVFTSSSTLQPMQNPLFLLHFAECLPSRKYLLSDGVCTTHCSTEFMKHVLPRFVSPAPTPSGRGALRGCCCHCAP